MRRALLQLPSTEAARLCGRSWTLSRSSGQTESISALYTRHYGIELRAFWAVTPLDVSLYLCSASCFSGCFSPSILCNTECRLIHTDIKADNILFGVEDDSIFEDIEREELERPCPRKEVDGRIIYTSRKPGIAKVKVLAPGSFPKACRSQVSLRLVDHLLKFGVLFSGNFDAGIELSPSSSLEETETNLEPDDRQQFLRLMREMMQWMPEKRSTAKELLEDPRLKEQA